MDKILLKTHKKIFNIQNFDSNENDTLPNIIFTGTITVLSNLTINKYSNFYSDLLFNQNLNISNNTIINTNNLSVNSLLMDRCYVTDNLNCDGTFLCNNMYINSLLHISTDSLINNNLSVLSNLNIDGICTLKNLYTQNISSNSILTIDSDNINIGNINSIISINGTTVNLLMNELEIENKIISLNFNSDSLKIDSGNLSGFEIYTINNNNGFIKTNIDNTCFEIKLPSDNNIKRIVELDLNNNIKISGYSIFNNNVTINNSLYVSKNLLVNDIDINNNLYISGTATMNNLYVSNLTLLGNSIIDNDLFITNLQITNTCYLNNNTTIMTSLNCNTIKLNNITVTENALLNNLSINGNITIKSNLTTNNLNILGNLNISNYNILNTGIFSNNLTTSNLYVTNDCVINNGTISSYIIVDNNMTVNNNTTIISNLYSNYTIIMPLKNFTNSKTAALNGIPVGGLFRTGDIVKVRIDVLPPVISLIGATTVSIVQNSMYNELGINISDDTQSIVTPYIVSIKSSNIELLTEAIQFSNNLNIPQINTTIVRNLIFTYMIGDNFNNIRTLNRQINITPVPATLVLFSDASIARTFKYNTEFSGTLTPSINIVGNTIVQVGGSSMWGFKGSAMPQADFSYNSKWSIMFKFKTTSVIQAEAIINIDSSLTGWGLPGRCTKTTDRPFIIDTWLCSMRQDAGDGGTTNIMTDTYFNSIINTDYFTGVYFAISRIDSIMQIKVYNLAGVLRWSAKSYDPWTYTLNQLLVTIYLSQPNASYIFYNGVLTSTLLELTPAHWNTYVI